MSLRKWLLGDYVDLNNRWQDSWGGRRLIGIPKLLGIALLVLVLVGVLNETFNLGIGKSPSFGDGSGYISINAFLISNVFELNKVTSEFSVVNIVIIGDSKKEHEIIDVKALNKSESGNSESIILMEDVGFSTNKGI